MLWLLLASAAVAVGGGAVVVGLRNRFAVVDVVGPSMEPTLRHGDRMLVRRASPERLRVGDIVVTEDAGPTGRPDPRPTTRPATRPARRAFALGQLADRQWIVKRVAAGPGDPTPASLSQVEGVTVGAPVPAGRFVLLGDNSDYSVDSRMRGFYRGEDILGIMARPMR